MAWFKKALASIGIGSATVDANLAGDALVPGEPVAITVNVQGGESAQQIDNIHLSLCCEYLDQVEIRSGGEQGPKTRLQKKTYRLVTWSLPYAFEIAPGESRQFDTELRVPLNTPVTIGDCKVWLETTVDIAMARDPEDTDRVTVRPEPLLEGVFTALESAGLRMLKVQCEAAKGFALPFAQQFELVPVEGPYHGVWRELGLVVYQDEEGLQLWFEINREGRGIGDLLARFIGTDSLKRKIHIPPHTGAKAAGEQVLAYLDKVA